MSKQKTAIGRILSLFVAVFATLFITAFIGNSSAFAESIVTNGMVTDSNDVRWDYVLTTDDEAGTQEVRIHFYDKPADTSTIIVPSLSEVLSLVPGARADLDTYFLESANTSVQSGYETDFPRRSPSVDTTKLDMSNTSKIQILGVSPLIDPEVETELIFGSNIVIGDNYGKKVRLNYCNNPYYYSWYDRYYCGSTSSEIVSIPNYANMTPDQINDYAPTAEDYNCHLISQATTLTFNENNCYINSLSVVSAPLGAFSGYKLKLTNFDASNFNYIGWEAFAESEIAGQTVTISGDTFLGSDIFRASNIKKAIINTETIGSGIFRDCAQLETVEYGDNITLVTDDAFAGSGLTSFDFSTTNIKTIGPRAFENAHLTEVNLEGINSIKYRAFAGNDIRELYFPKSINDLEAYLFENNSHLEKVTVAYDTLTSGTTLQFFVVLDNNWGTTEDQPTSTIKELTVIAPYAEDEPVSATHIPYEQYKWHYHATTREYMAEPCGYRHGHEGCSSAASNDYGYTQYSAYNSDGSGPAGATGSQFETDYADVDSKKNIIAPSYFANLHGLKVITVGEGYEYIGSSAFTDWTDAGSGEGAGEILFEAEDTGNRLYLPDSLKGIGNLAFDHLFNREYTEFTIPKNIEFIGIFAFKNVYYYDGDVDFPNLVALGDHAFEKTRTRNIYLHDKLRYMGAQVFSDCWFLNDITFDLDVFNPNIYIAWALPHRHAPDWYDGQFHITTEFGPRYSYRLNTATAEKFGIRQNFDQANNFWPMIFGTITFTDKNVSQLPNGYNNCYYFSQYSTDPVTGCPGGSYGTDIYNTFFGHINADKVDLGGTNWKILSPRMFVQTSIGEVVLPHGLEVIPGDAFSDSFIQEELILPDTLKVIGDAAFNFGMTQYSGHPWNSQTQRYEENPEYLQNHTIHIKKLPESLEYLGNDAFYNDWGLEADLNSPNLRHIGYKAFYGTRLHDVYLPPTVKSMHAAAFANISTLHDITIDFDLGALPPNYEEPFNPNDFPQSLIDFAGANIYQVLHMSCSARHMANNDSYKVTTFYSIFNQHDDFYDVHDPNNRNIILEYGQKLSQTHYGKVTFTENAKSDIYMTGTGYFSGLIFDELDLGEAGWKHLVKNVPWGFEDTKIGKLTLPKGLETVTQGALQNAEIEEPFELPSTLKTIGVSAFQNTKGTYTNALPEGLETIQYAAFYASDLTDNLVVPSTVTTIQPSAFNAGSADVHYDTITVKPENIDFNLANGQLMHQMFWQNDVDKMIIDSKTLPASVVGHTDNYQEFWHMPFDELVLNNLEKVTYKACDGCVNLQKVDASQNANLRLIDEEAFAGDEKLHLMTFSPDLSDETVTIGKYAFKSTAFETIGDESTDFDLTAAKFDGSEGYAFSEMPKLRSVSVPENFSNQTIPRATFYNDPELAKATVAYQITDMKNAAFANDDKLEQIFIWGDTAIEDKNIGGYTMPTRAADDTIGDGFGPTIPEGTDIYAYSANVTEKYAGFEGREDFEGVFYPLDEVLYLTSNRPRVLFNEDETDFDKSDLVVYGLRRDGVVLQSNSWGEFDGTAYPVGTSNLTFEKMDAGIEADPAAGTVYTTPVPVQLLSLANENFANIGFEFIRDPDSDDDKVRLINIIYTDAYTGGEPDTDIDPYAPVPQPTPGPYPIPFIPATLDEILKYVLVFGALTGTLVFLKKRRR